MNQKARICLVDLDGTLCDYESSLRADLATIESPEESHLAPDHDLWAMEKQPYFKRRMDLIRAQPGWWSRLEKMEDGFSVMQIAQDVGFKIHILTQGPRRVASAWSEKVSWVHQHVLPDFPNAQVTITRDKGLVYGRVLIDDHPPYIKRWLRHRPRGVVLMPDRPYNRDYKHPQVHRFSTETTTDEIRAVLQKAFDRL